MTTIESNTVTVNRSAKEVFEFLRDMNNFKQLLPQDKISEWDSTVTQCSFRVQGAITIPLVQTGLEEFSKIAIRSGEKAPFPFTLDIHILEKGAQECEGKLVFNGEMNTFVRMMAERPLTNLFNYIAAKLVEIKAAN